MTKEIGDRDERAYIQSLALQMSHLPSYVVSGERARKLNFTK